MILYTICILVTSWSFVGVGVSDLRRRVIHDYYLHSDKIIGQIWRIVSIFFGGKPVIRSERCKEVV